MKSIVALMLACFALAPKFAQANPLSTDEQAVVDLIVAEMLTNHQIEVSAKSFKLFSYWNRGKLTGPIIQNNPNVIAMLHKKAQNFFDTSVETEMTYVPGLYTAFDPFTTAGTYGGNNFGLVEFQSPKEIRILHIDGHAWRDQKVYDALAKKTSCGMRMNGPFETPADAQTVLISDRMCRPIAQAVMKALNVDAIDYSWNAATIKGCQPLQHAMIILNVDKFLPGLMSMTNDNPANDPMLNEKSSIEDLWRKGGISIPDGLQKMDLWPRMTLNPRTQALTPQLFNCQK